MIRLVNVRWIVIHHSATAGDINTVHNIIENQKRRYGADSVRDTYHYIISKEGIITKWIDEGHVAGHCGVDGTPDWENPCNFNSISVCFAGNFEEQKEMPSTQFGAGVSLLRRLAKKYVLGKDRIIGHRDVIPTQCPGRYFPLETIREEVFESMKDNEKWKEELSEWLYKNGLTKEIHDPEETVKIWTLAAILKNFVDVLEVKIGGKKQ